MRNIKVVRYQQSLDFLFARIEDLPDDLELQSHWAKYLCVLASGYIETSVRAIFTKYAEDTASPNVANFVEKEMDWLQNPKMEKILEYTGRFNNSWAENLKSVTQGELKDAVDSIVSNRNLISHGQHVGVTFARLRAWYSKAKNVMDIIERQCYA